MPGAIAGIVTDLSATVLLAFCFFNPAIPRTLGVQTFENLRERRNTHDRRDSGGANFCCIATARLVDG